MALLLLPSGVGLLGVYASIADLMKTLAGMGIGTSGVRQIAESVGTGDQARIARTVTTLRRSALVLGLLGAFLLLALAKPVAWFSFGSSAQIWPVALLSIAVLFGVVSAGQTALIQAMRLIRDLAMINVLGSLFGLIVAIPIVYFLGRDGIVPSLVAVAGVGLIVSWWYSRKLQVERVEMTRSEVGNEARSLLKLGFVFMAAALMALGVACLVRIIVLRKLGEDAAGFYQASWAFGGLYVGFILQAMGADFFPRLTAVAQDNEACNKMVNEQAEISLLLAGPGILGTLCFSPLVITLFYSAKFAPAVAILQWICLGMMLRVASWPMSFILLAKGTRRAYFWTEVVANLAQVAFIWLAIRLFGLTGTGIAFFAGYVVYWFLIYAVVRKVSGFRWSPANRQIGTACLLLVMAGFASSQLLSPIPAMIVGGLITLAAGYTSAKVICRLVPMDRLPRVFRSLLQFLRVTPATLN